MKCLRDSNPRPLGRQSSTLTIWRQVSSVRTLISFCLSYPDPLVWRLRVYRPPTVVHLWWYLNILYCILFDRFRARWWRAWEARWTWSQRPARKWSSPWSTRPRAGSTRSWRSAGYPWPERIAWTWSSRKWFVLNWRLPQYNYWSESLKLKIIQWLTFVQILHIVSLVRKWKSCIAYHKL